MTFFQNRRFHIYDCDPFTREYLRLRFGSHLATTTTSSGDRTPPPPSGHLLRPPPDRPRSGVGAPVAMTPVPPHTRDCIGDPVDSVQSCLRLLPRQPKKDLKKFIDYSGKVNYLRFPSFSLFGKPYNFNICRPSGTRPVFAPRGAPATPTPAADSSSHTFCPTTPSTSTKCSQTTRGCQRESSSAGQQKNNPTYQFSHTYRINKYKRNLNLGIHTAVFRRRVSKPEPKVNGEVDFYTVDDFYIGETRNENNLSISLGSQRIIVLWASSDNYFLRFIRKRLLTRPTDPGSVINIFKC